MEKLSNFLDVFRNNLYVEYNKNTLLKDSVSPLVRGYEVVCTGDRVLLSYLERARRRISQSRVLQYNRGKEMSHTYPYPMSHTYPLPLSHSLPPPPLVKYKFSLKNYLLGFYATVKNLFLNKHTRLKFTTEDEIIPNLLCKENYTEEGLKDLETFQRERGSLKDVKNIEYVGGNEFVIEGGRIQIKIRVVEEEGIKIDKLTFGE